MTTTSNVYQGDEEGSVRARRRSAVTVHGRKTDNINYYLGRNK